jgi:hypothetical protein
MKKVLGWSILGFLIAATPLPAGVTVSFDVPTLNELLPALTLEEVAVPITESRSIRASFEELVVTGFAPGSGADGADRILTSVRVRVPALGLSLDLEPAMSLAVVEEAGRHLLELRFEDVGIPLPLAGSIDAAPFLTPLRFPADEVFLLEGTRGDVAIHSQLAKIEMEANVVRFEFDLEVVETSP